jgi:hypothetical protein
MDCFFEKEYFTKLLNIIDFLHEKKYTKVAKGITIVEV